jgi:carboxymethylenebutenolidase
MTTLSAEQQAMVALFQRHVNAELAGDLDTTMATMTDEPHLNHVASMAGGVGRDGVLAFYRDHLVGRFFPPDVTMTNVSRTVGHDRVVEEVVITFTHTTPVDWILPGVPPTGKRVEVAVVVVVGIKDGKISHEHIYWDQASVLVQIGLLDPKGLPVCGAESARKVLDPRLPPRRM